MHRLTRLDHDASRTTIRLEGRLVAACLPSVSAVCGECLRGGRALTIDLAGVAFLDDAAAAALRALRDAGAKLVGASAFVRALLEEPRP